MRDVEFSAFKELSGSDYYSNKGFLRAIVELRTNPLVELGVWLSHTQAGYINAPYTQTRFSNLQQIINSMKEHIEANKLQYYIAMGDFNVSGNTKEEYAEMLKLFKSVGAIDAYDGKQPGDTFESSLNTLIPHFAPMIPGGVKERLDYIFHSSEGITIEAFATNPRHQPQAFSLFKDLYTTDHDDDISDHWPIMALCRLKSQ
eukprot:TRINITY_DN4277_c0_g4_i1.p1 TRINITY_DN4277_c0_g4~~TRINITY_DN4277_c0_g4_i1.p1  ORF type:complete len:202 (+),score=54.02 TRINITY_DN4277_c0_g4_i1:291-896(+)